MALAAYAAETMKGEMIKSLKTRFVTGSWKTVPNRTFGISRNTNFNIHGTVFLWCLIVATPDLLQ